MLKTELLSKLGQWNGLLLLRLPYCVKQTKPKFLSLLWHVWRSSALGLLANDPFSCFSKRGSLIIWAHYPRKFGSPISGRPWTTDGYWAKITFTGIFRLQLPYHAFYLLSKKSSFHRTSRTSCALLCFAHTPSVKVFHLMIHLGRYSLIFIHPELVMMGSHLEQCCFKNEHGQSFTWVPITEKRFLGIFGKVMKTFFLTNKICKGGIGLL